MFKPVCSAAAFAEATTRSWSAATGRAAAGRSDHLVLSLWSVVLLALLLLLVLLLLLLQLLLVSITNNDYHYYYYYYYYSPQAGAGVPRVAALQAAAVPERHPPRVVERHDGLDITTPCIWILLSLIRLIIVTCTSTSTITITITITTTTTTIIIIIITSTFIIARLAQEDAEVRELGGEAEEAADRGGQQPHRLVAQCEGLAQRLRIRIYVCVYIYIYIYIYIYVCACIYLHVYLSIYRSIYLHLSLSLYLSIYIYIYVYIDIYIYISTSVYTCLCMYTHSSCEGLAQRLRVRRRPRVQRRLERVIQYNISMFDYIKSYKIIIKRDIYIYIYIYMYICIQCASSIAI